MSGDLWLSMSGGDQLTPVEEISRIEPSGQYGVTVTCRDGSVQTYHFISKGTPLEEMGERLAATIALCRSRGDVGLIGVHDDNDERSPSWCLLPPEELVGSGDGVRTRPGVGPVASSEALCKKTGAG